MNRKAPAALIAALLTACSLPSAADWTQARCEIYAKAYVTARPLAFAAPIQFSRLTSL
jgi:hypothetical protein